MGEINVGHTVSVFYPSFILNVYQYLKIPKPGFSLGRLHMGEGDKALMGGLMRGDIDLMGGPNLIDYITN